MNVGILRSSFASGCVTPQSVVDPRPRTVAHPEVEQHMSDVALGATPTAATRWRDGKLFLWPFTLFIPFLPELASGLSKKYGGQGWWWMPLAVVFVLIPVLDFVAKQDDGNPPEALVPELERKAVYRWVTFGYLPLMAIGLLLCAHVWTTQDLGWSGRLGMVFAIGSVTGIGIGIANAHELGHKREAVETWWARAVLSFTGYGHFMVEHNRGHHVRVATPEDPASARLGESFYRFWPRSTFGGMRSGWKLEADRLRLRGKSPFSLRNDVLNAWLMTPVLFGAFALAYGPGILVLLVGQAIWGFTLLEVVNYVEHYGLLRQRVSDGGRYEAINHRHSWNSNALMTNVFLLHLQRHSDHHAYPLRRYHVLRSFADSPQLPAGYATMIVLALLPPLWRKVMDPRVLAHYDGDITRANLEPTARNRYLKRYAPAGTTSA
jgi:alkane 1-monooxygenase